ncbi:MAG: phosphatase PAP2 family protein [Bacteroidia bacterium]
MLESLLHWDTEAFLTIHHCRNGFFDVCAYVLSSRGAFIPLYIFLAYLLWRIWKRECWLPILAFGFLILSTDQTANYFKRNMMRKRPCNNEQINKQVITPSGCGGTYGFYSGHAANSATAALFFWLLFRHRKNKNWSLLLFVWSLLVSWSRIYQGVHYPLDVLTGMLSGFAWAAVLYFIFIQALKRFRPDALKIQAAS